uniref:Uncharacterized protein n=1 Tax=Anopheles stephensi TaxID=30069 RepID=A0A182XXE6_ANOST
MAANQAVNISVDDGIPLDFLAEMHVAMDCLPVDEEEANRIIAEKLRREQQERVRRFNNAWNIQPIEHEEVTANPRIVASSSSSSVGVKVPLVESVRDPRIIARNTQTLLETAIIQRQTYPAIGPLNEPSPQVDAVIQQKKARARMHSANQVNLVEEDDDDDGVVVFEEEPPYNEEPRRKERSRVATRSSSAATAAQQQRLHDTGRSHPRGRQSRRRHSRSPSRSPTHRRRKSHNRSRSRHRSRSYSRSRSSSPCSEHSHGTVDSRGRSSRKAPVVDQTAMLQMMAMTMQMFNQMNGTQLPMPVGDHVPYAAAMNPIPGLPDELAPPQLTPAAFRNMFANRATSTRGGRPEEVVDRSGDLSTDAVENQEAKYDVSTELFLEGKLSFSDFLSMKPSSTRSDQIAAVDPKVPKRINQAISVLEQQDTKKQSARFLYVPPTFYDTEEDRQQQHQQKVHSRSPLVWNNQNVLFQFTSTAKEAKQCQPFRNVNAKLKDLVLKLGLDEGIVSQQLEKVMHAATAAAEKNADNNSASALSSRIHAITTVPATPGSGKVRHLIDRSVQTDGYACMQCVARSKKTFVSSFSQTAATVLRVDAEMQTSGPPLSAPNTLTLDGLNAEQIETVEAIVRFIRARQLAGTIESVQHALRNDRVVSAGMTPAIQHNAQRLLAQMKSADVQQRTDSFAVGSYHQQQHNSLGYYSNSYQSTMPQASQLQQPLPHYDTPRDARFRHPGSGITRTVRTTTTTMAEQIIPACYDSQPQLSKKTKKRLKLQQSQQQLQHQQRW